MLETSKKGLVYTINVMGTLRGMLKGGVIEFPNTVNFYAIHTAAAHLRRTVGMRFSVKTLKGEGYKVIRVE